MDVKGAYSSGRASGITAATEAPRKATSYKLLRAPPAAVRGFLTPLRLFSRLPASVFVWLSEWLLPPSSNFDKSFSSSHHPSLSSPSPRPPPCTYRAPQQVIKVRASYTSLGPNVVFIGSFTVAQQTKASAPRGTKHKMCVCLGDLATS